MHFSRWSQWGGCRRDCGGSGLVEQCRCSMCATSCAATRYELAFHTLPGGCTYGPIDYEFDGGQCGYEQVGNAPINGGPYTLGGGASGSMATFINGFVQIRLTRDPDGLLLARFYLVPEDGDPTNCNQRWIYDPAQEPAPPYWYSMAATCQTIDPDPSKTYFRPVTTDVASDLVETYFPPGSGNCCPCVQCSQFSEDPVDLPGTPLPDHWIEVRGDWDYGGAAPSTGAGWYSADSDALLLLNQPTAAGYDWRCVVVPVAIIFAAGEFNLVFGYEDADNYYTARWLFNGSFDVMGDDDSLKIYRTVAGVESEVTAEVEKKTQYVGHGPGTGLQFGVCVDAERGYVTAWVRDASDTWACLITSATLPAPGGDYVGFGPISGGNGGYRRNTLGVVSADCLTCRRMSTCGTTDLGQEPCISGLMSGSYMLTPGGGWVRAVNDPPFDWHPGNCACPQWSAQSVVVERIDAYPPFNTVEGSPYPPNLCPWWFQETMPVGATADKYGCTTYPIVKYDAWLWVERSTVETGKLRWRAYIAIYKSCGGCASYVDSAAEYASDPFDPETWDCMSPFVLTQVFEIFDREHFLTSPSCDPPGSPGFCSETGMCEGDIGPTLLVEPV